MEFAKIFVLPEDRPFGVRGAHLDLVDSEGLVVLLVDDSSLNLDPQRILFLSVLVLVLVLVHIHILTTSREVTGKQTRVDRFLAKRTLERNSVLQGLLNLLELLESGLELFGSFFHTCQCVNEVLVSLHQLPFVVCFELQVGLQGGDGLRVQLFLLAEDLTHLSQS